MLHVAPIKPLLRNFVGVVHFKSQSSFRAEVFSGNPRTPKPNLALGSLARVWNRSAKRGNFCKSEKNCTWNILVKVKLDLEFSVQEEERGKRSWTWNNLSEEAREREELDLE